MQKPRGSNDPRGFLVTKSFSDEQIIKRVGEIEAAGKKNVITVKPQPSKHKKAQKAPM